MSGPGNRAATVLALALVALSGCAAATATGPSAATAAAPAPTTAPATPAAAPPELRVMTWNVRTNTYDAPDWAPVVAEQRPDVVAFQEICVGDAEDLVDLLREEHGLTYELAPGPAREALYETCRDTAAGPVVFGQAVLSRVPLVDPVTTILPDGDDLDEPRSVLAVTLDVPGAPVRLLTTHITIGPERGDSEEKGQRRLDLQAAQVDVVGRAAAGSGERVLVMGDFNMAPQDGRLDVFEESGLLDVDRDRNAPTGGNDAEKPGSPAVHKIDYMFVKGLERIGEPETFWVPSSDHRPLVATLRP
ncbi:endonuclease/exonuclease/phosphatase family protein [Pseudonocardia lacus]|uniref:endonuclease/exonuclease/phosphatase family protein n=1 Tax=Pseudonocardia lacus TaxID=2835865 RepID=UPI001BDBDED2|nr:endonuclease/exonuclease/phosphatase family protein [Pseudonocardia lacus]